MWIYYQPVKVYFGAGEVKKIGTYMEQNQLDKALLIADPFLLANGVAQSVVDASQGKVLATIGEVEPNPTVDNVEKCAAKAREIGAECIIGLGGGSAIDCAKSVAVALKQNCTAMDLLNGQAVKEALPIIAISTTAGTGSEVTAGAVLSDKATQKKLAIFGPAIFATVAIVDPELTYSCPASVTARSGIDVIAHSLDAMTSVKANNITDRLAVSAAKMAFENLEAVVADGNNLEARARMAEASVTAGLAFSQTGTTGSHACSYILTSKYHMPHGEACAFTLDYWFQENAKVKPALNDYAKEMGFSDVQALCGKLAELKKAFGFKTTLKEAGAELDEIDLIVETSMQSGNMTNNIAKLSSEEVKAMFVSRFSE